MNDPKLCIIGGSPRSGTRNFADLISAHPDTQLFGEVGHYALPKVKGALEEMAAYHAEETSRRTLRGRGRQKKFASHRVALTLTGMYAKSPQMPFNFNALTSRHVVGFKTPQIEKRWRLMNELYGEFENERHFFFCIRNLDQNFLSLHSRGWRKDVEEYVERLLPLLQSIVKFKAWNESKDGGWQIHLLHLNAFLDAASREDWLFDRVYRPLFGGDARQPAAQALASTSNRNSTLNVTGKPARSELTDEEQNFLTNSAELKEAVERFNAAFNTDLPILTPK
ncbi:hypothetical protein X907_2154 [Glycocaulis alkaliphilus]|uniref:Uncharacterized protein n=1 Tax=Glycocaulis alkaliphilus TaxID=1434191 RepID=A0A3T0EB22_9PROT|nr:hypothetical protein [Glycocaulis alkaliphilus]AZU04675.1 hypothetical protein X907_2154 [Glycocaulis alkaliphilus]GGB68618.1 hypothetical protein GCM10007417_05510 [Glycocaulis alkaliphilus]